VDFQAFLSALATDWVSKMSGIASVVLLIAGVARDWEKVPRWAFWTAAAVCFFFASARVWTIEHRAVEAARLDTKHVQEKLDALTQPKFEVSHGSTLVGQWVNANAGTISHYAGLLITVTVTNRGAPSVVKGYRVTAKFNDGTELEGRATAFPLGQRTITFPSPSGPVEIPTAASLFVRGAVRILRFPIECGKRNVGSRNDLYA
jgi:hypothetical protein